MKYFIVRKDRLTGRLGVISETNMDKLIQKYGDLENV
jgi:hypothetical protein